MGLIVAGWMGPIVAIVTIVVKFATVIPYCRNRLIAVDAHKYTSRHSMAMLWHLCFCQCYGLSKTIYQSCP